jgi:hypothetical protein
MGFEYGKAAKWLKKEMAALREPYGSEARLEKARVKIEAYASGQGTLGAATVSLSTLGLSEGRKGCVRVLDGDARGWQQLDRSFLYRTWAIRLLACAYDADVRPDKNARMTLDAAANAWSEATALGNVELADWLEARLRRIDAGDGSLSGKDMNALVALAAHVATGKPAAALKQSGWADLGPYARAIDGGLRPADYDELAEYHVQQTGESGFQPFVNPPFRLLPFELFALEKRTGVRIESPQHPLLTSPLAVRREAGEIPMPDDLRGVIERARMEMPV